VLFAVLASKCESIAPRTWWPAPAAATRRSEQRRHPSAGIGDLDRVVLFCIHGQSAPACAELRSARLSRRGGSPKRGVAVPRTLLCPATSDTNHSRLASNPLSLRRYSSLAYPPHLPTNEIRIDRSIVGACAAKEPISRDRPGRQTSASMASQKAWRHSRFGGSSERSCHAGLAITSAHHVARAVERMAPEPPGGNVQATRERVRASRPGPTTWLRARVPGRAAARCRRRGARSAGRRSG
jgi:hypothetical protein